MFAGFLTHSVTHIEPSVIALLGAGLLVLITDLRPREYMSAVEWETLLFFAGLFIMVGALVKSGSIERLAGLVTAATGGDPLTAAMLILFGSALLSGVIDNIPYVATMTPLVQSLTAGIADPVQAQALWWSLALGADFGGNLTAIGASANVVVLGIARRADHPDLVLGVHPQGRDRHRRHGRARRAVPVAALLRPGVLSPPPGDVPNL